MPLPSCHCVLLTPVGRGAVATVLVEGLRATEAVSTCFQPASGKTLAQARLGRIVFGRWKGSQNASEELVVCRRTETQIEIHCHGGAAAAENVLQSLVAEGFATLDWREWVKSAEPDPIMADARLALAAARTQRTALILLDQYAGALRRAIERAAAACETGNLVGAADELEQLLKYKNIGRHLIEPWRVVLAGAPNVGKSSLINALLGFERSIVQDEPGTTRDVLTALTAFDGWPVELSDTAGLRESVGWGQRACERWPTASETSPLTTHHSLPGGPARPESRWPHPTVDDIEALGIAKAREQVSAADLVLLVFDASQPWTPENQQLADSLPAALVIFNKCDLAMNPSTLEPAGLRASALTGAGLPEIMTAIVSRLVPIAPSTGAAIPFTSEQMVALEVAREEVQQGRGHCAATALLYMLRVQVADSS